MANASMPYGEYACQGILSGIKGRGEGRMGQKIYLPVPVSETVCGLLLALSLTSMVAARAPSANGVNFTLMVQCAFAARLTPQVFVSVKSPGSAPVNVMLMPISGVGRLLVRVTFLAALVVPTFCAAKVSEVGETAA